MRLPPRRRPTFCDYVEDLVVLLERNLLARTPTCGTPLGPKDAGGVAEARAETKSTVL